MPYSQPLDHIPIWALFIVTVLVFLIAVEVGFRVGKLKRSRREQAQKAQVSTVLGASLALLAFFLAFTFSMASSRYDTRRELVLEETNVIETTSLRAQLLPEPYRTEIQDLLLKYVDVRARVGLANKNETIQQLIVRSEELHSLLWSQVVALIEKKPSSVVTGLFIQSLNNVIDLHGKRVTVSMRNRIPTIIFLTLYFVAFLSMAMMGYQAGLIGMRSLVANLALVITFSAVLMLITDLERPSQKLFGVSQQSIVELRSKLGRTP